MSYYIVMEVLTNSAKADGHSKNKIRATLKNDSEFESGEDLTFTVTGNGALFSNGGTEQTITTGALGTAEVEVTSDRGGYVEIRATLSTDRNVVASQVIEFKSDSVSPVEISQIVPVLSGVKEGKKISRRDLKAGAKLLITIPKYKDMYRNERFYLYVNGIHTSADYIRDVNSHAYIYMDDEDLKNVTGKFNLFLTTIDRYPPVATHISELFEIID